MACCGSSNKFDEALFILFVYKNPDFIPVDMLMFYNYHLRY